MEDLDRINNAIEVTRASWDRQEGHDETWDHGRRLYRGEVRAER